MRESSWRAPPSLPWPPPPAAAPPPGWLGSGTGGTGKGGGGGKAGRRPAMRLSSAGLGGGRRRSVYEKDDGTDAARRVGGRPGRPSEQSRKPRGAEGSLRNGRREDATHGRGELDRGGGDGNGLRSDLSRYYVVLTRDAGVILDVGDGE